MKIKKIMIVDDEPNVAKLYEEYLAEYGYEVFTENNPNNVMTSFTSFQPDLVLLDVNMPEKDGLTLLKEIKKVIPKIPVYLLTAHDEHKRNFNSLYADEYILKSRDPKIILTLIEKEGNKMSTP
ncbi:MAG: response regulator [Calditerrivibrio sp.]|nr:response regulator [Calditerrivibrio sp.]